MLGVRVGYPRPTTGVSAGWRACVQSTVGILEPAGVEVTEAEGSASHRLRPL